MSYEVIIVGGSYAGLSAGMQLARARRRVLIIDAGLPRNRFAVYAHGFLGQDGKRPADIIDEARRQLLLYPTVAFVDGAAVSAAVYDGGFVVALADGRRVDGARLVLATGVRDELPAIAGMQERWGVTVLHCPYCHGYEVGDQQLGVIGTSDMAAQHAALFADWGPTTYFTQGAFEPNEETAAHLAARGVRIERSPVVELMGVAPGLEALRLADGRVVPMGALFVAPKTHMASPLAGQLGCAFDDGPTGPFIRVDEFKQTTVKGVFAAGDAASAMPNATFASAGGVLAGVAAHRSLIWPS
jgi:thioredoxin reductase